MANWIMLLLFAFQVAAETDTTETVTDATTAATPVTIPATSTTTPKYDVNLLSSIIPMKEGLPGSICGCDLKELSCDFNCCCDTDCTDIDHRLFTECSVKEVTTQWGYNYCDISGGFLCIYRDNVKKLAIYEDVQLTEAETAVLARNSFTWQPSFSESNRLNYWINQQTYKFESPLFVFKEGYPTFTVFSIPSSWNSASCNYRKPVQFLQNAQSQCRTENRDLATLCSNFEWESTYVSQNFSLVKYPFLVNSQNVNESLIPIQVRLCLNETSCEKRGLVNRPQWDPVTQTCNNIVRTVIYKFQFSATFEISAILADVRLQNVTASDRYISTNYSVTFEMYMQGFQRSGNPGYLRGKPILAGVLNYSTNSVENVTIATVLKTSSLMKPILFGYDSYDVLTVNDIVGEDHPNCNHWRDMIYSSLFEHRFDNLSSVLVDSFGDGSRNKTNDWLPLSVYENLSNCKRGQLHLHITISYAKVGLKNDPQNKIKSFLVNLTTSDNYEPGFQQLHKFTLVSTVKFVEVRTESKLILQRPPRIRVSIPADFFYPFLTSSALSAASSAFVTVVTFMLVVLSLFSTI